MALPALRRTSKEIVDNIEPAAGEAGLMIAIHFVLAKGRAGSIAFENPYRGRFFDNR